jgi:glycosyltransferase involved in cell wall biosynthesis
MTPESGESIPLVSVVIPTFNASSTLARTLDALVAQSHSSNVAYEVIVADDGSDDDTVALARSFGGPVRVLEGNRSGPAAARNRGAAVSSGNVLVFIDSDDRPLEGWLQEVADLFWEPSVGIGTWPATVRDLSNGTETVLTPDRYHVGGTLALAGCFAVRSSIFEDIGGYDPALRFGENSDLCERASVACDERGLAKASHRRVTIELSFNESAAHYDRYRLEALEYLLERDVDKYANRPQLRSRHLGIAAVNAARCEEWATARRHAIHSVSAWPRNFRAYPRLAAVMIPPLGRHLWSAESRRKRLDISRERRAGPR